MPNDTATCKAAIIAAFAARPVRLDIQSCIDIQPGLDPQETADMFKLAADPNRWKRRGKVTFMPAEMLEDDLFQTSWEYLHVDAPESGYDSSHANPPGQVDPAKGKITLCHFELFDPGPDWDGPYANIHIHARVYIQQGEVQQVCIYGEG